jgi:hypothetical protein
LIDSSPRFKTHRTNLTENRVTFGPESGPGAFFEHSLQWSATLPLPFISRENDVFIPLDVWHNAALFFIATLPDDPGARSAPFFFDVQVSWNIPEGGRPRLFRVQAIAVNSKPPGVTTPVFLATVEISVPSLNE